MTVTISPEQLTGEVPDPREIDLILARMDPLVEEMVSASTEMEEELLLRRIEELVAA